MAIKLKQKASVLTPASGHATVYVNASDNLKEDRVKIRLRILISKHSKAYNLSYIIII